MTSTATIHQTARVARGGCRHNSRPLLFATAVLLVNALASASANVFAVEAPAASAIRPANFPCQTLPLATTLVTQLDGRVQPLSEFVGERGLVLVFSSTQCPISRSVVPVVEGLARAQEFTGWNWLTVYPRSDEARAEIEQHEREFARTIPAVRPVATDNAAGTGGQLLTEALAVRLVPTAVVIAADGSLCYHGRIDDRFVRRGGPQRAVSQCDLEVVLRELLAGETVRGRITTPIGCPLPKTLTMASESTPEAGTPTVTSQRVTWHGQIEPLLRNHCAECHREGGVGLFSLITLDEARSWAPDLRELTKARIMPPWHVRGGDHAFENERRLSDEQIAEIAHWVDAGCPVGEPTATSDAPATADSGTLEIAANSRATDLWTIGEPDLVLAPRDEFVLEAEGRDEYRCFLFPTNFTEPQAVSAFEVIPGNRSAVHHVIVFLDTSGKARERDERDPAEGYRTNGGGPGFLPVGAIGGWAPGNSPHRFPTGMARMIPPGADIVVQVHYHRTGKVERDQTRVGVHFATQPIRHAIYSEAMAPYGFPIMRMSLPAGEPRIRIAGEKMLGADLLLLAITPHMHLLGKEMQVRATLPDGTQQLLIDVDWDFNWQETYYFREPLVLPRGTRIEMVAHFDNSAANPKNPSQPPQLVRWGEQTNDEMCLCFFEVTSPTPVDDPTQLHTPTPVDTFRREAVQRLSTTFRDRFPGFGRKEPRTK